MELTEIKRVNYIYDCAGKTPTQVQNELRVKGIRGFVVNVDKDKVTMLIEKQYSKSNMEVMQIWKNGGMVEWN
ncbi:hypothetical protein [Staphylococcus chromogenes]|uniref:hypothetical protein n=1 Tax=Staphylococcus chromogenes TaxID=46126 RepID=UPI00188E21A3|nr:hypothetical protein [Staphylococcus chromogenes]